MSASDLSKIRHTVTVSKRTDGYCHSLTFLKGVRGNLDCLIADYVKEVPADKTLGLSEDPLGNVPMADVFALVEREDVRVDVVYLHPTRAAELLKTDSVDPETRAEYLMEGVLGNLWGAAILASEACPVGVVAVLGEESFEDMPKTFAGRIAILKAADVPKRKPLFG